jgi:LysW-gamma-L-lysine carboxypeptidase
VTLGYKGSAWYEFTAKRALAHTSAQSESACEAAVSFWNRLRPRGATPASRMFDQLCRRCAGCSSDGLNERAVLRVTCGCRRPRPAECEDWLTGWRAAERHAEDCRCRLIGRRRTRRWCGAARGDSRRAARRASAKSGTSDSTAAGLGLPAGGLRSGDARLDHTPDEHLVLADYARAVAVLAACGGDHPGGEHVGTPVACPTA